MLTGFSLDPLLGLGLVNSPRKLKVSSPFTVNVDLPYSVQRGETISIPVVVYNYQDRDINAEVTLHNTEQKFEFMPKENKENETISK